MSVNVGRFWIDVGRCLLPKAALVGDKKNVACSPICSKIENSTDENRVWKNMYILAKNAKSASTYSFYKVVTDVQDVCNISVCNIYFTL